MKHGNLRFIGRNIRPGVQPGGFAPGTKFESPMPTKTTQPDLRYREHQEIIEAANALLEGRRVLR